MTTALDDARNELWFSPISVWEVLLLLDRGHLKSQMEPRRFVAQLFDGLKEAPIDREIATESCFLATSHADPADRFLMGTARTCRLTLMTLDDHILRSRACETFRFE
jgi:PIN domain nuclease of toxin-antitoxin system